MIVVTGATGKLGSAVVEQLLQSVPPADLRVSVRDATKAAHFTSQGIDVRQASFGDTDALQHAFEGADTVLVVSTDRMGQANVDACISAIDAAVASGATRVVYTSHMGASHSSAFQACVDHAQVEDHLATIDTAWTALRNGFYALSALEFAEPGIQQGHVDLPADGPVSWTAHRDLAAAAAAVLTGTYVVDGPTPPLTAQTTATFADIAARGAQLTGHAVKRTVVDDEEFVSQMLTWGTPEVVARQLLGIFVAARHGEFQATDPTLATILGHAPMSVQELMTTR